MEGRGAPGVGAAGTGGLGVGVNIINVAFREKRFDENEQNIHPNLRGTSGRVRGGGRAAAAGPGTPAWAPPPPRTRPSP